MKKSTLLIFVAFAITLVSAQKAYTEDSDEAADEQARLAMNRAKNQPIIDDIDRMPSKSKKVPLLERFQANSISNAAWESRGELTLWYDIKDRLVSVDVDNHDIGSKNLEQTFTQMCEEDALYQLNIPDLELISSQQACQYAKQGLNETLTFFTNAQGNLISFGYEVCKLAIFLILFPRLLITNT